SAKYRRALLPKARSPPDAQEQPPLSTQTMNKPVSFFLFTLALGFAEHAQSNDQPRMELVSKRPRGGSIREVFLKVQGEL
ncbi:hypothetical protein ACMWP9_35065, partial [Escherichia coli]